MEVWLLACCWLSALLSADRRTFPVRMAWRFTKSERLQGFASCGSRTMVREVILAGVRPCQPMRAYCIPSLSAFWLLRALAACPRLRGAGFHLAVPRGWRKPWLPCPEVAVVVVHIAALALVWRAHGYAWEDLELVVSRGLCVPTRGKAPRSGPALVILGAVQLKADRPQAAAPVPGTRQLWLYVWPWLGGFARDRGLVV